jgi:hypothetical protein
MDRETTQVDLTCAEEEEEWEKREEVGEGSKGTSVLIHYLTVDLSITLHLIHYLTNCRPVCYASFDTLPN